MLSREKKQQLVEELLDVLKKNASIIFTDFTGLAASELNTLKQSLNEVGAGYKVIKKSLWAVALKKAGVKGDIGFPEHKGSLAVAYGSGDGVEEAKVLHSLTLSSKGFTILGGFLDRVFVDSGKVNELAMLPSRQELIAKVVATIASPMQSFAGVLNAATRDFVSVLRNIKSK